jgi:hypothetical protein
LRGRVGRATTVRDRLIRWGGQKSRPGIAQALFAIRAHGAEQLSNRFPADEIFAVE